MSNSTAELEIRRVLVRACKEGRHSPSGPWYIQLPLDYAILAYAAEHCLIADTKARAWNGAILPSYRSVRDDDYWYVAATNGELLRFTCGDHDDCLADVNLARACHREKCHREKQVREEALKEVENMRDPNAKTIVNMELVEGMRARLAAKSVKYEVKFGGLLYTALRARVLDDGTLVFFSSDGREHARKPGEYWEAGTCPEDESPE